MEFVFQNNIDKVLPYFIKLEMDVELKPYMSLMLPPNWEYQKQLIDGVFLYKENKTAQSNIIVLTLEDGNLPVDNLFAVGEDIIEYNEQLEEKQKLLKLKMKELEEFVYASEINDIVNLKIKLTPTESPVEKVITQLKEETK